MRVHDIAHLELFVEDQVSVPGKRSAARRAACSTEESTMSNEFDDQRRMFLVLKNSEGPHSLWPTAPDASRSI